MKRNVLVLLVVATMALMMAIPAIAGGDNKPTPVTDARFTVHNHDIAVSVAVRHLDESATADHPVVLGCFVTVLLSDLWEMTAPPQCHWDGVNEKSRYSYTLFYRQKGVKGNWIETYSINLLDFASVATDDEGVHITPMGVMPEDGIVSFQSAKFDDIVHGSDPRQFALRASEQQ